MMNFALKKMKFALKMVNSDLIGQVNISPEDIQRLWDVLSNTVAICIKIDEFCIKNDEFCI